jgi:hypothetical protein
MNEQLSLFSVEVWCPVAGYESVYEVSNMGRVRRIKRGSGTHVGKVLQGSPNTGGYLQVTLYDGRGNNRFALVHVLVARAFVGDCPEGMEVNHIDLNNKNNRADNLEYMTRSDNAKHAHKHFRGNYRLNSKQVAEIRAARVYGATLNQLANGYGVASTTIHNIVKKQTWVRDAQNNVLYSISRDRPSAAMLSMRSPKPPPLSRLTPFQRYLLADWYATHDCMQRMAEQGAWDIADSFLATLRSLERELGFTPHPAAAPVLKGARP